MTVAFSIDVTEDHGLACIGLTGEVDLAAKPQIQAQTSRLIETATVERVIVDLAAVTFLDSSGIGGLVGCKRLAADAGKHMQVIGAVGQVADVLDLVGVAEFLAQ